MYINKITMVLVIILDNKTQAYEIRLGHDRSLEFCMPHNQKQVVLSTKNVYLNVIEKDNYFLKGIG